MFDLLKLKPSISSRGLSDVQTKWLSNKNNVWPPKELKYKRAIPDTYTIQLHRQTLTYEAPEDNL